MWLVHFQCSYLKRLFFNPFWFKHFDTNCSWKDTNSLLIHLHPHTLKTIYIPFNSNSLSQRTQLRYFYLLYWYFKFFCFCFCFFGHYCLCLRYLYTETNFFILLIILTYLTIIPIGTSLFCAVIYERCKSIILEKNSRTK